MVRFGLLVNGAGLRSIKLLNNNYKNLSKMDLILVKNDNQNRVLNPKMIIKKAFLSRLMCKAWNIKKEKGLTLSKALKLAWVWAIKEATKKPKNQTLLF